MHNHSIDVSALINSKKNRKWCNPVEIAQILSDVTRMYRYEKIYDINEGEMIEGDWTISPYNANQICSHIDGFRVLFLQPRELVFHYDEGVKYFDLQCAELEQVSNDAPYNDCYCSIESFMPNYIDDNHSTFILNGKTLHAHSNHMIFISRILKGCIRITLPDFN